MDDRFTGPADPQPPVTPGQQPIPPTAPETSHKKKVIIFVVIAIILIAGAAFGAYQFEHSRAVKAEKRQQSQIDSLKKQINSSQKPTDTKSTSSTAAADPYAGWKTYTLKYEKLTFKYPANWQPKDYSNGPNENPNTDVVDFVAPDGFVFDIIDGMKPGGDPKTLVPDSPWPVTFADQSMYLVFSHPSESKLTHQNSNSVGGMDLLTNPKNQYSWPADKNASSTAMVNTGGSNMSINAWYQTSSGTKYFSTVQQAMNDPEYKNAKLVIESMHY